MVMSRVKVLGQQSISDTILSNKPLSYTMQSML